MRLTLEIDRNHARGTSTHKALQEAPSPSPIEPTADEPPSNSPWEAWALRRRTCAPRTQQNRCRLGLPAFSAPGIEDDELMGLQIPHVALAECGRSVRLGLR